MNKVDYFTEIEDEFVRLRQKHLWISTLDWALIDTWKSEGLPISVVLRGIKSAFEKAGKRTGQPKINSLLYCQGAVEQAYKTYKESQIGANAESNSSQQTDQFSTENILQFLKARLTNLKEAYLRAGDKPLAQEAIQRTFARLDEVVNRTTPRLGIVVELLEADLTSIEDFLLSILLQSLSDEERSTIENEGKAQLQSYKKKMQADIYEKTLANFIAKRVREMYGIQRFSLCYM